MKRVGARTKSAPLGDLAPARGPAITRAAIDAVRDAQVPWLLVLIPVSLLVMAGLLVLVLARFVAMPAVPPSIESSLDEAPDLGMPSTSEVKGDAWSCGSDRSARARAQRLADRGHTRQVAAGPRQADDVPVGAPTGLRILGATI